MLKAVKRYCFIELIITFIVRFVNGFLSNLSSEFTLYLQIVFQSAQIRGIQ